MKIWIRDSVNQEPGIQSVKILHFFCFVWLVLLFSQAKSLVCAPMENCYSNLMHDDGKGLLSLILSLIGLNVNPSLFFLKPQHIPPALLPWCFKAGRMWSRAWLFADHHLAGAGERVFERDAAARPAEPAVRWEESVGGGAAVCDTP